MKIRKTFVFWGIMLILSLTGCSVHRPAPVNPVVEPPLSYASAGENKMSAVPEVNWWIAFQDHTLNDLMDRCFSRNPSLAQSMARLQQALAISRQRNADRMPSLNLEAGGGKSRQIGMAGDTTGTSYSVSLAAKYEIDFWNRLESLSEAQRLEAEATEQDRYALILSLSAQVAENYFIMAEQRAKLSLIDRIIEARRENLILVEDRYNEGMVSAVDLYQARQNLAYARSQRPGVEEILAKTAHALSVLVGEYPDQSIGGNIRQLPDMPEAFPLGLPSDLLKYRPDIQSSMLKLQAADQQTAASVAARFPSVNLLASYGYAGSDFGTSISGTVWNLAGNLAMPLIDWQKRKSEVERNEAVFSERLAGYRQTMLIAFQEVEDALTANRSAMASIERVHAEVTESEHTLRLSMERYTDGLSDYLPVLTAQNNYFDSEIRLLSARRKLISARISLARAIGGKWMEAITHTGKKIDNG
ncbi:MAG: efflux transporter outer membrane subunit [Desulfobacteraceae bacterium]|nr:MAG: efflux transporter outer membrane subunit [Desulfobacteraceae bacterium]